MNGYVLSSLTDGNNVYLVPGPDAENVYTSISEIPQEFLDTQLTINNTQKLTKLFKKYK